MGGGSSSSAPGLDMPGSFVPTVTAITTSQDLQWMVQPTLISSVAPGQSGTGTTTMTQSVALDPYDMPGPSFSSGSGFTPPSSDTPGPLRQSRSRRRTRDETVSEVRVGLNGFLSLYAEIVSLFLMHECHTHVHVL